MLVFCYSLEASYKISSLGVYAEKSFVGFTNQISSCDTADNLPIGWKLFSKQVKLLNVKDVVIDFLLNLSNSFRIKFIIAYVNYWTIYMLFLAYARKSFR